MNLAEIYEKHHQEKSRFGFSVLEKERFAWFKKFLPLGGNMLDLGCRDGSLTRHFSEHMTHITGVDIDPSAVRKAQENIPQGRFLQMDLLGDWTDIANQTFDVILCSEVLEHVYDPGSIVSRTAPLLKKGGVFIGSVPNAFFLKHRLRYLLGKRRYTPLEDPTHITQFNKKELEGILSGLQGNVTIEGYTKPPFSSLAKNIPSLFAFDFLFAVRIR